MEKTFEKIWKFAIPYLKKGKIKNFVLHTKGVVKAMDLLLEKEKGDKDILIPASLLHDIGWSKVPSKLQMSNDKAKKINALELHLKYAPPIIEEILTEVGYNGNKIKKVIDVVLAHKFETPRRLDKQLLIDADTLSDSFKEQFYSDVKEFKTTPKENYNFRKNNHFYTITAQIIFNKELGKRRKEFSHARK